MSDVLNVAEALSVNAQVFPDRVAAKDLSRSLTYSQLDRRVSRLANALAGLGLAPGDRVAVYAYNRLEWIEIYAACARGGFVAVPVNFRLAEPEVRFVVEDCGAKAMLVDAPLADTVREVRGDLAIPDSAFVQLGGAPAPGFHAYEDLLRCSSEEPPQVHVRPEDPWTIMYTSGTTGRPKGAIRSHRSYALFYLINAFEFGFHRGDTGLCVMPLCHVNSVFYGFVFLYVGGSVCVYDRRSFDPEHLLGVVADQGITFTSLVPTHYVMMLDLPAPVRARHDTSRVGKLLVSSAPARRETKLAIMDAFPNSRLFEAYGSTEAGLVTLLRPEDQLARVGSIGREIAGTGRIRLLGPDGIDVPDGEVGELYSRTPTAFDGYRGMPEASAAAFRGPYCSAGDMARRDADGFYTLVDRKSNMVITGGEKVYPSEVEHALASHPDVRDVAVIGLPDAKWGEAVTAIVVPRAGAAPRSESLVEHARGRLAGFKCPRRVVFIRDDEMPRTPTGKVLHRVLRERYGTPAAQP